MLGTFFGTPAQTAYAHGLNLGDNGCFLFRLPLRRQTGACGFACVAAVLNSTACAGTPPAPPAALTWQRVAVFMQGQDKCRARHPCIPRTACSARLFRLRFFGSFRAFPAFSRLRAAIHYQKRRKPTPVPRAVGRLSRQTVRNGATQATTGAPVLLLSLSVGAPLLFTSTTPRPPLLAGAPGSVTLAAQPQSRLKNIYLTFTATGIIIINAR